MTVTPTLMNTFIIKFPEICSLTWKLPQKKSGGIPNNLLTRMALIGSSANGKENKQFFDSVKLCQRWSLKG